MVYPNPDPEGDRAKVDANAKATASAMIRNLRESVDEAQNTSSEEQLRETIITGLKRTYAGLKAPYLDEHARQQIALNPTIAAQIRSLKIGDHLERVIFAFDKAFEELNIPESQRTQLSN